MDQIEFVQSLSETNLLDVFEQSLLEKLRDSYEKEGKISDDLLESLYFYYKSPLLEALNLIDIHGISNCLTKYSLEDNSRFLYQVSGSKGTNYYLFPEISFCLCSSFKYNVLNKLDILYCKHIIAAKLCLSLNKLQTKTIGEKELAELIKLIH